MHIEITTDPCANLRSTHLALGELQRLNAAQMPTDYAVHCTVHAGLDEYDFTLVDVDCTWVFVNSYWLGEDGVLYNTETHGLRN